MEMMWFYIAVVLAISDEFHSKIMWSVFFDFYVVLAGLIRKTVSSSIQLWLIHEGIESVFHFVVLSLVFVNLEIGILGALIHMVVDIYHEFVGSDYGWLYHRALHFAIESVFFIMIFAGLSA